MAGPVCGGLSDAFDEAKPSWGQEYLELKTILTAEEYEAADLPDSFFDAVIGNVPFGQFQVSDRRYDKHHFLIHDYFFAKTLDKVRPGA